MNDTVTNNINSEIIIKAIANEIRRNIVRLLIGKELTYSEVAHLLGFDLKRESGKFNFHLRELVSAELVHSEDDRYALTHKGEEVYYLLIDIERDTKVDPHGLVTALIRLEGRKEFWFYLSSIAIIGSIWALLLGGLTILMGDGFLEWTTGGAMTVVGGLTLFYALRYYLSTANSLLGGQSSASKIISTFFLLSFQWYLIRAKHRLTYIPSTFFALMGWFLTLLVTMLHVIEGVERVGPGLYWIDLTAVIALAMGILLLARQYLRTEQVRD